MRLFTAVACAAVASLVSAGTITVTSPTSGEFLGKSNNVSFNIRNAVSKVTVRVTATQVADPTITVSTQREFTPNVDGEIGGSIPLNLSSGLANGPYSLTVVATEPNASYNVVPAIPVIVDVKDPRFIQFNPISGNFVRGLVPISSLFDEENMKEWRVQVNNADIPNNTGSTTILSVLWDSTLETADGAKTITITAEDQAGNKASQSISVTIDRVAPTSTILAPTGAEIILPGSRLAVVAVIDDQFANSVDERTVDVTIEDTNGNFVMRVARRTIRNNGNSLTWAGRIRDASKLPSEFDLVITAGDKAGNRATTQRLRLKVGGSRSKSDLLRALNVPEEEGSSETLGEVVGKAQTKASNLRKRASGAGGKKN